MGSIRYTDDHILDYMEVDASNAIFEVEVPEGWAGKTVGELDVRKRYNINILAVKDEGEFSIAISPDTYLAENNNITGVRRIQGTSEMLPYIIKLPDRLVKR